MEALKNCPDCGVAPSKPHKQNCDVERCSVCGGQRLQCSCPRHDKLFSRWTGVWPGVGEALALGLYSKWVSGKGWVKCDKTDPEGDADLNELARSGLAKYFFIKPKRNEKEKPPRRSSW